MFRLNKTLFISFLFFLNLQVFPQHKVVYLGAIDSEIDLGLSPYVSRVISEAEKENADAVIFHINTFGGRVDAATQIKDAILASKVLTIAFINNRAISAGSLIALSCRKIAMVPGSSIGAATVVDQSGQKLSEKYQSYMRSEMRSTAERNGRRTDIAQGMVDERIVVEGLDDSTTLITLTADEAKKYGIADTLVNNIDDLLKAFDLKGAEVKRMDFNWAEEVVRFLNNPIVSSLLIMIGLIGIYTEIKTPGWGLPGTVALISLALFFGSSYILQLASILDILLFIAGVVLLALEIFVIPGFGVTGITGIVLIVAALFMALVGSGPFIDWNQVSIAIFQLAGALVCSILIFLLLVKFLPKTSAFNRLVLADVESADKGFVSYPSDKELIGKEGIALTDLRPAGSAEFSGERIDVVADWDYIVRGKKVKVIRVEGIKVVVKETGSS
ncbi:MAG TPA: nodulation protein NfeD [Ignavibacteriaceae bacterium]|nr:nodulation protein NfeD [Ignavibacteriaceae bacterium]